MLSQTTSIFNMLVGSFLSLETKNGRQAMSRKPAFRNTSMAARRGMFPLRVEVKDDLFADIGGKPLQYP
jgi:hypothetical protein